MSFSLSRIPQSSGFAIQEQIASLIESCDSDYRAKLSALLPSVHPPAEGSREVILLWICLAQSLLLLSCRAARRGGLPEETVLALANRYQEAFADAGDIRRLDEVFDQMLDDFIRRLRQCRQACVLSPPVRSCMDYIRLHYDRNISAAVLAGMMGYTASYLSSKFREEVGLTLSAYILRVRMEHAIHLILQSDLSITAICRAVGYRSRSFFNAQFRSYTDMTPSALRRSGHLPAAEACCPFIEFQPGPLA